MVTPNATGTAGYQQGGTTVLNNDSVNENTVAGPGAGAAGWGISGFQLNAIYGFGAGAHFTGGEMAALGTLSCNLITTGGFPTCLGEHAMGFETTGSGDTAVGNDSMRNSVGVSFGTALGKNAHRDSFGANNVANGANALFGNAASIQVGGTKTAGDVISITFTSAFLTGSPVTVNYTVTSGDTLATIPANFCTAFAAAALSDNYGCNTDSARAPFVIEISHNGTSTAGNIVTVTGSVGGASTETLTIGGGSSGGNNTATGTYAMLGYRMTSAHDNTANGQGALQNPTSAANDNCTGSGACQFMADDINSNAIGAGTLNHTSGGNFGNNVLGNGCGSTITSGNQNLIEGDCTTGGGYITSGSNNAEIGTGASVISVTASNGLSIQNAIYGNGNNGSGSTISGGNIGFYVNPTLPIDFGREARAQTSFVIGPVAPTLSTGEMGWQRISPSGTAPGASNTKISWVCGTTAGTAKMIAYAGTSTTAATIVDNVGTGVSGC